MTSKFSNIVANIFFNFKILTSLYRKPKCLKNYILAILKNDFFINNLRIMNQNPIVLHVHPLHIPIMPSEISDHTKLCIAEIIMSKNHIVKRKKKKTSRKSK